MESFIRFLCKKQYINTCLSGGLPPPPSPKQSGGGGGIALSRQNEDAVQTCALAVMLIMSPKVNNDYDDDESKNIFYGYIPDLPILST